MLSKMKLIIELRYLNLVTNRMNPFLLFIKNVYISGVLLHASSRFIVIFACIIVISLLLFLAISY